jgi:CBS domain containing-hemolysin-like protein
VTYLALGFAAVLVVFTSVIRAAGASLVRTPRADALRDAADGNRSAVVIAELLDDRARLQPSLGIFNTGLLVLAAIPAAWAMARIASGAMLFGAMVLLGVLVVFVGDVLPRTLGRRRPRTLAYRFAWLLRPAVALGDAAADLVVELDDDIEEEEEDDEVGADERALISQVLDFTDSIVREVMVPRTDMVTLPSQATIDEALEAVVAEGRSRIPVVGEGADDVLGILYARDLLALMDEQDRSRRAGEIMRPASFVPETKRVPELLREMQANQTHMAIVVDEWGGTAGLVTIEDLLEEIVGEIADEYDSEEPMIVPLEEGGYLIDARLAIDDLQDLTGVSFPDEEWDTVGGLVLGLAGRVPREGESFEVDDHVITAERVQGRRISRVRVRSR